MCFYYCCVLWYFVDACVFAWVLFSGYFRDETPAFSLQNFKAKDQRLHDLLGGFRPFQHP